ncbi:MAG: hypothetical protein M3Y82_10645 [Verrucomicrobiota bacterium]|nr:hypothetical protein [Verrucomicrobiota bacterium]
MNEILSKINRAQRVSFVVGILFLVLCGVGVVFSPHEFFISYLISFVFWFGLTLGCFHAAMIHYLTGGHWGNVTRRFLEAGFMTLPVMAIFFIPILFGLHDLYAWARPEAVAANKMLQQKAVYENFTGFLIRAIFVFGIWVLIATRLRKWSLQQDATGETASTIKLRTLSGPGIVIVPLTATFAVVDWVMSIEPAWFSTVFAVILFAGQILITFAFVILLLAWFQSQLPFREAITPKHFLDLGNLLLAFVMFWTYVAFSQFLIVYSGNQPHEIGWYLHRIAGSWKWLVCFIGLFHFFIPFFVLLFRAAKKNVRALATVALLIFLVNALEIFWTIAPTFYPSGIKIHWTDFTAWFGIGGIWLAIFAANLKRHPLLAQNLSPTETVIPETANAR